MSSGDGAALALAFWLFVLLVAGVTWAIEGIVALLQVVF